jgi:hypothetical protein
MTRCPTPPHFPARRTPARLLIGQRVIAAARHNVLAYAAVDCVHAVAGPERVQARFVHHMGDAVVAEGKLDPLQDLRRQSRLGIGRSVSAE